MNPSHVHLRDDKGSTLVILTPGEAFKEMDALWRELETKGWDPHWVGDLKTRSYRIEVQHGRLIVMAEAWGCDDPECLKDMDGL